MMPDTPRAQAPRAPAGRRALLLTLAVGALALVAATPWLITPYNGSGPWYESTASFPRLALLLVALGGLAELAWPRAPRDDADDEELDASHSRPRQVLVVMALFIAYGLLVPVLGFWGATAAFTIAAGLALGLRARVALALGLPLAAVMWAVFAWGLKVHFG